LTADISELVERWTLGPLVRALQALRGVDLVTAVVLAEYGAWIPCPSSDWLPSR